MSLQAGVMIIAYLVTLRHILFSKLILDSGLWKEACKLAPTTCQFYNCFVESFRSIIRSKALYGLASVNPILS